MNRTQLTCDGWKLVTTKAVCSDRGSIRKIRIRYDNKISIAHSSDHGITRESHRRGLCQRSIITNSKRRGIRALTPLNRTVPRLHLHTDSVILIGQLPSPRPRHVHGIRH
jgi:hypothetical protein